MDNRLCDKCGLLPQDGTKPKAPCTCKPKKKCCKKDRCCDDGMTTVSIPANLGDEITGEIKLADGNYVSSLVTYEANGHQFLYDKNGVYSPVGSGGGEGGVSDFNGLENRPKYAGERMTGATDIPDVEATVSEAVVAEAEAREIADNGLQSQIDAITVSSDVKDIVGTYAQLQAYDTATLGNNDIIKVLQDESHNDETTYYRWNADTQEFTLIGEEGPYYTKSQTNSLLSDKLDLDTIFWGQTVSNGSVSGSITLSPADTINWGDSNPSIIGNGMSSLMLRSGVLDSDATGQYSQLAVGRSGIVLDHYADGAWDRKALLSGVADGVNQYDAVNKGQLDAVAASAGGIPTDATFWGVSYDATNNYVRGARLNVGLDNSDIFRTIIFSPTGDVTSTSMYIRSNSSQNTLTLAAYAGLNFSVANYVRAALYSDRLEFRTINGVIPRIKNIADPTDLQDAATKNYVDSIYPVGAVFTSTSSTAPTIAGGTWAEIGTQTIGSSTVYYYERTA